MYTEDFVVRYGELSSDGYVKPTAILQYLQEIATDHSGSCGYGVYELQEMGIGWVIMCWDVKLGRRIRWRERLTCRTWPYEFRSYVGKRAYEIVAEDGEVVAQADSWWAMMDLKEMKAAPGTEEIARALGEDGKALTARRTRRLNRSFSARLTSTRTATSTTFVLARWLFPTCRRLRISANSALNTGIRGISARR